MSSLRRYAPFALLVATQMVLVLVAPSHGSGGGTQLGGQFQGGPAAQSGGTVAPGVNGSVSGAPGTTGVPGAPGGTGTTTGSVGSGATTGGSTNGTATLASGTTAGGQLCVTGLTEHLPCVPKWAGGNNGGATWAGVTDKQVTIVMYRPKDNAAVNAILQSTGTYTPPSAEQQMIGVVGDWINKHFQLYNRKIKFIWTQGSCDIAPPVDSCFRGDADNLVSQYHPFAVFWTGDTNESAFMDELSRKGVVNWGGWAFTDQFAQSLRPYHYDVFMGGDTQADITGRWICQRLANRPPKYAGDATIKAQPVRKFAVTYPNTAMTTPAAKRLENIIKGCDKNHFVYDSPYSSDTSTAAQQATTNTAQTKNAGVTSVIWFSDPIAPAYGTKAQASQNWFPEEVIAGEGLLDYDALAQAYDQTEWAHAFGPSDIAEQYPINDSDAGLIWKAEGQSGSPNQNANLMTSYMLSVAGGVMAAGPKLTPLTYEYGMLTQPAYDSWEQWHNPHLEYIKYGKGDYTAISDIREVWYNPSQTSPTNNRPGAYVAMNGGRRYQLSNIPSGDPGFPASV
jgi:hypothetical protein